MVNIFTLGLQLTDLKKKKNCWNFLVPGGGCVKQYRQSPSVRLLEQHSFLYQRLQLAYLSDPRHHDFQLHLALSLPDCRPGPQRRSLYPRVGLMLGDQESTVYIDTRHCLVWQRNTGLQNGARGPVHPVWKVGN